MGAREERDSGPQLQAPVHAVREDAAGIGRQPVHGAHQHQSQAGFGARPLDKRGGGKPAQRDEHHAASQPVQPIQHVHAIDDAHDAEHGQRHRPCPQIQHVARFDNVTHMEYDDVAQVHHQQRAEDLRGNAYLR